MIRCFVICFNTPVSWLQDICFHLNRIGFQVEILNNASTSLSTVGWLNTCPYIVHNFDVNYGNLVLWSSGIYGSICEEFFGLTDPDLDLSNLPDDTIAKFKTGMKQFNSPKCGSALRINNLPDNFLAKQQVLGWEGGMWNHLANHFYAAPTDTTFSLYQTTRFPVHMVCGLRVGGPYEVEHRPWYITNETIDDEIADWLETCDPLISTMSRYLKPVLDEYKSRNE